MCARLSPRQIDALYSTLAVSDRPHVSIEFACMNHALYYSYLHNIMFQVNGEIREYRCGSLLFHFYALFLFCGFKGAQERDIISMLNMRR